MNQNGDRGAVWLPGRGADPSDGTWQP